MTVDGGVRARPALPGAEAPISSTTPAPATFIFAQTGGDDYWRARAPAKVLGARTIAVPPRLMQRAFTRPNSSTPLPWRIELETVDGQQHTFSTMKAWKQFTRTRPAVLTETIRSVFPKLEGVVVWQRPDMARAALTLAMQQEGIRTVGETDDNYFAKADQNLFLRYNRFNDDERLQHARAFACQNACVFSTAHLRDTYQRELRARVGRRFVPELHVCRNHVPLADWPERLESDGPLRVGFMGSTSHVWDIAALGYASFHAAHGLGCETIFIGYNPADPDAHTPGWDPGEEYRSEESRYQISKWKQVVSRHIPWVEPSEYHRAALPLDIGIAPLRGNSFNMGKSDVKAIELTISGAAAVLQNSPVYNSAGWVHERNCLMASTQEDFAHAVVRLVRDAKLRYELVTAAQEMVASERGDEQLRKEWSDALTG
jgi:hypothetical protein